MSQVPVSTPFNIHLDFEIAPFHRRLVAWFADLAVLLLFAQGARFFMEMMPNKRGADGLDFLLVSLPMLLYPLLMESIFQGQSLGKKLMGIRVISVEGGEPQIGQYLMRWLFRLWEWPLVFGTVAYNGWGLFAQVLICGIIGIVVVITIAVNRYGQRLGDLAAGTAVVDIRYQYSLSDTVFREVDTQNYEPKFPQVMRLSDRDINAIKNVLTQSNKTGRYDTANRVAAKIKEVLQIDTDMYTQDFLETLLYDYNYLATKE
ncbi:MAG TPA: RDD family protein [Phnomibacter sp.]|nr:RDD family protein [Phnomibacter sp.]